MANDPTEMNQPAPEGDNYIRPKDSAPEDQEAKKQKESEEQDNVNIWLQRIEHSEQYRKHSAEFYRWRQLLEAYRGRYYALMQSTDIYVPMLNLIFAFIKSEIPALYLNNPKIKVNPKKGSSVVGAKILEKAINYIWRAKRLKRENKKNLMDTMTAGHSWFKSGYTGKFGSVEDSNETWEFIEEEEFFGYRIPIDNITFNPDSNDPPYDCRWIAHQVWIPLEELKKDGSYQNVEHINVNTNERNEKQMWMNEQDEKLRYDSTIPMVCLYEVWDKLTRTRFVISKGCSYYLKPPSEWPYKLKGFPFSFLRLNDDPRNPYGIPDCFMFEQSVIELMKLFAQQLDHVKRFNRQLLARKGALDDNAKSQFQNAITGAVVEADIATNESINNVITPIPYPPLQPDIYNIQAALKDYLVLISGKPYSEFGGKQDTSTRTIRELMEMQKGASDRRAEKVDSVQDFIKDIAMNYISLLQQFVDIPFYVKVSDEDPQTIMEALKGRPSAGQENAVTSPDGFTFTKEDVIGDFEVEIVAGSTVPMDQAKKMELLIQTIQMFPQLGAKPGGPVARLIGTEIADEADLPEVVEAIKQEMKENEEAAKAAQEQADQIQQFQVAQETAKTQLKSEAEATKQSKVTIDFLKLNQDAKAKELESLSKETEKK